MATPPRTVKRDGKILQLGDGSDAMAFESITIQPQVLGTLTVSPLVVCQKIFVPS
jgi:hypothetical protein